MNIFHNLMSSFPIFRNYKIWMLYIAVKTETGSQLHSLQVIEINELANAFLRYVFKSTVENRMFLQIRFRRDYLLKFVTW